MTKHEKVKAILEQIKELFDGLPPESGSVQFDVRSYTTPEVSLHGFKAYADGVAVLRELGCGERSKQVYPEGRCVLGGKNDLVEYTVFVDALPPSCRIEKVIERVPKQQTVDTGDFIEIERTKVICGNGTNGHSLTPPTETRVEEKV